MHEASIRTLSLGEAVVTIFNIGDIYLPLVDHMKLPPGVPAREEDLAEFSNQATLPIHSIHIRLPTTSVMVDAGAYDVGADSEYEIEGYQPPPCLLKQMAAVAIEPKEVDHVVITHRHWDHFNGTTQEVDGENQPCFPNARHYISRVDWQDISELLEDSDSIESRTLGLLHGKGLLDLVDGNRELVEGLNILAAPGETAGHQIVRAHSGGEMLYCLGDLYHHPLEFEREDWMVSWADREKTMRSRAALTSSAIQERATLVSTHIRSAGTLTQTPRGARWEAVAARAKGPSS